MENALAAAQILGALGLFFLGIGALWAVSVYSKKNR
jgi:hypothetical protein